MLRAPRPSPRRALAWGIGLSLLLHLLLLLLASRTWLTPDVNWQRPVEPQAEPMAPTMRAHRLRILAESAPETPPPQPHEPAIPRRTPFDEVAPAAPVSVPTEPAVETSPARRLRPRLGDPRLWDRPEPPPPPVKTDLERARERIAGRIQELNDSLATEATAASRATDWTVQGKDGKRWGISPGKVHLGDLTLPLPFGFSAPPDKAADARDRARKDAEVERQSETARQRENFEDRAKAIRERKEKERQEKKTGSGSTGGSGTSGSGSGSE